MKKFLFKLMIKLFKSKFARDQGHRLTETAEPARIRLRQWLLREPSTVDKSQSDRLSLGLESLRLTLRRWLFSDVPPVSAGSAHDGSSQNQHA